MGALNAHQHIRCLYAGGQRFPVSRIISFLNPITALAGLFPAPGMNLLIFWTMIVMHCVSAIITVSLLTTLAVER